MVVYWTTQWILVNNAPFTCALVFSDNKAAIKTLSGFINIFRIVRECHSCLHLLSGRFTSVSGISGKGDSDLPGRSMDLRQRCSFHLVFSDSQAAIKPLSGFVNNSRIVGEFCRCPDLLSGHFTSVFQAEVMAFYRVAQWILDNYSPFTSVLVFSDIQAAIKILSGIVNNSRVVRECRRCLDLLSSRFNSVSLVWIPGHCRISGNCRADELAWAGALLPKSSSIELGIPLALAKMVIARKFFRDANIFWINEESYSTAGLTWPLKDRRRTSQLLGFDRDIISNTVAMLTGNCVMGKHAEWMRFPCNDFCH